MTDQLATVLQTLLVPRQHAWLPEARSMALQMRWSSLSKT